MLQKGKEYVKDRSKTAFPRWVETENEIVSLVLRKKKDLKQL